MMQQKATIPLIVVAVVLVLGLVVFLGKTFLAPSPSGHTEPPSWIDPATGKPIYVMAGPYGPYVQLGDQEEGKKKKPQRASLFKTMDVETLCLEEALSLLTLPRVVGADSEGREIVASPGRFGPYLKREDGDTRSMTAWYRRYARLTTGDARLR